TLAGMAAYRGSTSQAKYRRRRPRPASSRIAPPTHVPDTAASRRPAPAVHLRLAPPPRLPHLVVRAAGVAGRHLDAERRPGLAGTGPDRLARAVGHRHRAAVPAGAAAGPAGRGGGGLAPAPPADRLHPERGAAPGARAERARIERAGAALAPVRPGAAAGPGQRLRPAGPPSLCGRAGPARGPA